MATTNPSGAAAPAVRAHRSTILSIAEALRSEIGGEVVIKEGQRTGRVFVAGGRVAWATSSTLPTTFGARLVSAGLVTHADLTSVFEECRRTGRNFGEALVEWKLLGVDVLRQELLRHLAEVFREILFWPSAIALFVPSSRPYSGKISFALPEIFDAVDRTAAPGRSVPAEVRAALASDLVGLAIAETLGVPPAPTTAAPVAAVAQAAPPEPAPHPGPAPAADVEPSRPAAQIVAAELVVERLRSLDGYRGAGFFDPSGALMGSDRAEGGGDPAALATAAARLIEAARAAASIPQLGEVAEIVMRADGVILLVRNVTVTGLGRVGAYLALAEAANVALARIQLERVLPAVVVELA